MTLSSISVVSEYAWLYGCTNLSIGRLKLRNNDTDFKELLYLVSVPVAVEGSSRRRPSDDQVWLKIKDKTGVTNSTSFQQLDENKRIEMFLELKDSGASLRQLERLTGIGKGVIHRIWCAGR